MSSLIKKLEFIGRPLASVANLFHEARIAFMAFIGSVVAGKTMLAKLHQERKIDKRRLLLIKFLK